MTSFTCRVQLRFWSPTTPRYLNFVTFSRSSPFIATINCDVSFLLLLAKSISLVLSVLKGKFPQTTMWIGWGESNFRNLTVKVWADLDNPFKSSDYTKFCMSPSLDGTLPEYVISQEDNSPLTLYIDFYNVIYFSWISIVLLIKFIHKCMHIHLSP